MKSTSSEIVSRTGYNKKLPQESGSQLVVQKHALFYCNLGRKDQLVVKIEVKIMGSGPRPYIRAKTRVLTSQFQFLLIF